MIHNNVAMDLRMQLIGRGQIQEGFAEKPDVSVSYVKRIARGREQIVNKSIIVAYGWHNRGCPPLPVMKRKRSFVSDSD